MSIALQVFDLMKIQIEYSNVKKFPFFFHTIIVSRESGMYILYNFQKLINNS
jgi:hypothetical protein